MDSIQEKIFDSLRNKGINAFNNGNYKEAVDSFGKALELDPKNAELFYLKGNALMCLKQFMEAIKIYTLAIEYKPDFDNAFFKRALAKKENKDRVGAKDDLQKVLKINPNHFECKYELENIVKIEEESNIFGEFVDPRDNQKYRTVRIGEQIWMLDFLRFETTKNTLFGKKSSGCWIYDDKTTNLEKYGRLYSWEVVESALPKGWRLPGVKDIELIIRITSGIKDAIIPFNRNEGTIRWVSSYHEVYRSDIFRKIKNNYNLFQILGGHKAIKKDRPKHWERYVDIEKRAFIWLISGICNYTDYDIYKDDVFSKNKEDIACNIICIKSLI